MPNTRLGQKYSKPALPEPDLLKAFIWERINIKGHKLSYEQLAAKTGLSSANIRVLLNEKHTEDWKAEQRHVICKALGLDEGRIQATEYYYDNLPKLFQK